MIYEFSAPMPFAKEDIDKLLEINKQVTKSKITSLYFCVPNNSKDITGFEQKRLYLDKKYNFEYWKTLILYSIENGFDFIYLLNGQKVYNTSFENINNNLQKLEQLLSNLKYLGCDKLRVYSSQLIDYLNNNYPEFKIYLSTSREFQNIKQFEIFFSMFDNIKGIVLPYDLNKNFQLLKNLKMKFPNLEYEIMVNEGCLCSCPLRIEHNLSNTYIKKDKKVISSFCSDLFTLKCKEYKQNYFFEYLTTLRAIYPWEISEYMKIGINKFKLVGRNIPAFRTGELIDFYKSFLMGIEDEKQFECCIPVNSIHIQYNSNLPRVIKLFNYKKYLPNINHFKKYGHLCASRCGVECRYCYKCAEKIQKVFEKKMKEKEKHAHYVQACKIST